jgi:hypothetical protein
MAKYDEDVGGWTAGVGVQLFDATASKEFTYKTYLFAVCVPERSL